jgi:hypothetical protein
MRTLPAPPPGYRLTKTGYSQAAAAIARIVPNGS